MLIAQISDCHLAAPGERTFGHVDTAAALARVIAHVNATRPLPDLAVITGDLTNIGSQDEAAHVARLLAGLACPWLVVPGNHDRRASLWQAFSPDHCARDTAGFANQMRDLGALTVLALDTLDEGRPGGAYCPARQEWLAGALAQASGRPVLAFAHHPPLPLGLPETDADGFAGADALLAALAGHGRVLRLGAGHIHMATTSVAQGVTIVTAPSVAMPVRRDFSEGGAPSRFTDAPPGYLMHHLTAGGRLVSHVITLPERAGQAPRHFPFASLPSDAS